MRASGLLLPSLLVATGIMHSHPPDQPCPVFTADDTISKISPKDRIFRFEGGYLAIVTELRLDTDGSPVAYHPANKGTTHLCNGLDPIIEGKRITDKSSSSPCFAAVRAAIDAQWHRTASPGFCIYGFLAPGNKAAGVNCDAWGGSFGTGEIPLQGANEPAPGFFISTTSTTNPGVFTGDTQARYLNSDATPYAVIPSTLVRRGLLPKKGGIAWAWNPKTGRTASAVFGDTQSKFGEISIAFAQKLEKGEIRAISPSALSGNGEIPWPYGKRRTGEVRLMHSPSAPVALLYFSQPPAPELPSFDPQNLETAAAALLQRTGGPDRMQSCLKAVLP